MREFTYMKYCSSRLCQKSSQSRTPNVLRSCGRIDAVTMCRYVLEAILFIVLQKCIAAQCSSICAHNLTFSVRWAPNPFCKKVLPTFSLPPSQKLFAFNILADVAGVFDEFLSVVAAVDDESRGHLDAESLCHIGIDGCVDSLVLKSHLVKHKFRHFAVGAFRLNKE